MGTFNTGTYDKPLIRSDDDYFDGEFYTPSDYFETKALVGLPFISYINFSVESELFRGYYENMYINHILTIELELDVDECMGMGVDSIISVSFDFKLENVDFYSLDYESLLDEVWELSKFYEFSFDYSDLSRMIDFLYLNFVGRFNRKIIKPITAETEYGGWCNSYGIIDDTGHYAYG